MKHYKTILKPYLTAKIIHRSRPCFFFGKKNPVNRAPWRRRFSPPVPIDLGGRWGTWPQRRGRWPFFHGNFYGNPMDITLWLCQQLAIENGHRNSEFSHEKWWFSIAMLVYQRVMSTLDTLWLCQQFAIWSHGPVEILWVFPWKMVIFHSYVSLPEGK